MTDKEMNDVHERVEIIATSERKIYDGLTFQEVLELMRNGNDDISFDYERIYNGMILVLVVWDNGCDRATQTLAMFDGQEVAGYMVNALYDLV